MFRLLLYAAIAFGIFSGTYGSPINTRDGKKVSKASQASSSIPHFDLLHKNKTKGLEKEPAANNESVAQ